MTTYTLVAYRPNCEETIRGNVYGRSDSMLETEVYSSPDKIAERVAHFKFLNLKGLRSEEDWEIYIFIDGRDYEYFNDEEHNVLSSIIEKSEVCLKTLVDKDNEQKRLKELEEQTKRKLKEQELEERELKEYNRLYAKYGPR